MKYGAKRIIYIAILIISSTSAHADLECSATRGGFRFESDSWTGTDKLEHFAVSAPFGAIGGWLTRDTEHPVIYGTLIGTTPGLALQILDGTCPTGGFSYKDLFADALGALTGAWLAHWAVTYSRGSHDRTFGLRYDNEF
jgi:putative lipoprotein